MDVKLKTFPATFGKVELGSVLPVMSEDRDIIARIRFTAPTHVAVRLNCGTLVVGQVAGAGEARVHKAFLVEDGRLQSIGGFGGWGDWHQTALVEATVIAYGWWLSKQANAARVAAIVPELEVLLSLLADEAVLPRRHCDAIRRGTVKVRLSLADTTTLPLQSRFCVSQLVVTFPFCSTWSHAVVRAVLRDWTSWLLPQHDVHYDSTWALTVWA